MKASFVRSRNAAAAVTGRNVPSAAARSLAEDELFLDGGLFTTHYRAESHDFVVVAPPLFEEQARTRKILVNLARDLAGRGLQVVRFDYPGTGLSEGSHESLTFGGAVAALEKAVAYCQAHGARRVHLVGFRFGAYLALTAASRLPGACVVLWEPVLDLAGYFQEMLRIEMSNQMLTFGKVRYNRDELITRLRAGESVLIAGHRVSAALYGDLEGAPVLDTAALSIPSLCGRLTILLWENRKLHDLATRAGITSVLVEGVKFSWKHIRMLEPRSTDLFGKTAAVLEPHAAPDIGAALAAQTRHTTQEAT